MSSQYTNPYAPPQAPELYPSAVAPSAADDAAVPDGVLEPLRATRPWVLFLAIVGFIGAGLMVLLGLAMLAMGGARGGPGAGMPAGIGLVYVVLAALYIWPSLHLLRYGSAITRLVRDPHMERLGVALGHQRSFWKLVGIMTAVVLALYPIGIVVAIALVAARAVR